MISAPVCPLSGEDACIMRSALRRKRHLRANWLFSTVARN